MVVLIYTISKFLEYSIWGYFGYRVFGRRPSIFQVASIGASRWLIGFGEAVLFFLVTPTKEDVKAVYFWFIYLFVFLSGWSLGKYFTFSGQVYSKIQILFLGRWWDRRFIFDRYAVA